MDLLFKDQNARPTYAIDFLRNPVLPYGFDFTRGTDAWDFSPDKLLEQSGQNVPRFDYDPVTGGSLGLLLENTSKNEIRNPTCVGAVAGTSGTLPTYWSQYTNVTSGLTRTLVGTGTEYGMPYIDIRFTGTPNPASSFYQLYLESSSVILVSVGQTWTCSAFMRLVGGSAAGMSGIAIGLDEQNGSTYLTGGFSTAVMPTSELTLLTHTRVLANASTNTIKPAISYRFTTGAVDITMRFYVPQAEQAPGWSSRIQGNMAATTRAKDSCVNTSISSWFNQNAGSFVFDFVPGADSADWIYPLIFSAGDSQADSIGIQFSPANSPRAVMRTGNVVQADLVFTSISPTVRGQKYRFGCAWNSASMIACVNGGTVLEDTSLTLPSGIARCRLGASTSSIAVCNGYHQRLSYWNRKLSGPELQRLTAL